MKVVLTIVVLLVAPLIIYGQESRIYLGTEIAGKLGWYNLDGRKSAVAPRPGFRVGFTTTYFMNGAPFIKTEVNLNQFSGRTSNGILREQFLEAGIGAGIRSSRTLFEIRKRPFVQTFEVGILYYSLIGREVAESAGSNFEKVENMDHAYSNFPLYIDMGVAHFGEVNFFRVSLRLIRSLPSMTIVHKDQSNPVNRRMFSSELCVSWSL